MPDIEPKEKFFTKQLATIFVTVLIALIGFVGTVTGVGPLVGTPINVKRIPSYDYFDLTARIAVSDELSITMGVQNLFDKDPPNVGNTIGSTTYNSGNTYPSTYDALGRRYAVSARLRF